MNLNREVDVPEFGKVVDAIEADDKPRADFLKACLAKLNLKVNREQNAVPSLSRLHLTSLKSDDTANILESLNDLISIEDEEEFIKDENDTFHLVKQSAKSMGAFSPALPVIGTDQNDGEDRLLDCSAIVKDMIVHDKEHPVSKETPYFNHSAYYANLQNYYSINKDVNLAFGSNLLYGEVVTSTNTILEK